MSLEQRARLASDDLVLTSARVDVEGRLAELPELRRRRARTRTLVTAAVVAVAMVIGGAWFATSTTGPSHTAPNVFDQPVDPIPGHTDEPGILRTGFIGLPPEGATPSSPATGELVLSVFTRTSVRVWVYADGRMITWRETPSTMGSASEAAASGSASGFLEQHLTPEGIDLLRSYLVDNAEALEPYDPSTGDTPLVRVGDEILSASVPECGFEQGCQRIGFPETWLPASAWADQRFRAYVPTEIQVCYFGWQESPENLHGPPSDPAPTPVERVRDVLPADVAGLLWPVTRPDGGSAQRECAVVSNDDARAVNRSLQAAGFRRDTVTAPYLVLYPYAVPPAPGETEPTLGLLSFQPVLPHGEATCTSCG
ncbi:MAG TPA: hypothetical protein VIU11_10410 [Nakamurella sp.]